MTHTITEEIFFEKPHTVITIIADAKKYQFLVLGLGLIGFHKDRSILDADIKMFAKKIVFGESAMKERIRELSQGAQFMNKKF